jgi:hypothetical protein
MESEDKIKKNLLIGCTGSVAVVRIDQIIQVFKSSFNIKVVMTKNSREFADSIIGDYDKYAKENQVEFHFDEEEYRLFRESGAVLHIEVRI